MVPGQRSNEEQVRATALRRLNAEAMMAQSAAPELVGLVGYPQATFVPGRGSMMPRVAFVAESPSSKDATHRAPLCGAAGRLFDRLLFGIGLTRNDVYVTHLVPWLPPTNRETTLQERTVCSGWLRRELALLGRPPVVLLGRGVSEFLLLRPYANLLGEWAYSPVLRSHCLSVRHPAYGVYQEKNIEAMTRQYRAILDAEAAHNATF